MSFNFQISNTKFQIPNSKCQNSNFKFQISILIRFKFFSESKFLGFVEAPVGVFSNFAFFRNSCQEKSATPPQTRQEKSATPSKTDKENMVTPKTLPGKTCYYSKPATWSKTDQKKNATPSF